MSSARAVVATSCALLFAEACAVRLAQAADPSPPPDVIEAAERISFADRLQIELARSLYRQHRFDEAERELRSLAARDALDRVATVLWGDIHRERKDPASAERYYRAAAQMEPDDAGVQLRLAQVLRQLGRDADAELALAHYELLAAARANR